MIGPGNRFRVGVEIGATFTVAAGHGEPWDCPFDMVQSDGDYGRVTWPGGAPA